MVNRKRGLIRLGIVMALGWCLFWGGVAYFSNQASRLYLKELTEIRERSLKRGIDADERYPVLTAHFMARADEANERVTASVHWGIGLPLILSIVASIGWWIYRGFKPRPGPRGE